MEWTKPTFVEISLSGEVTAYANVDSPVQPVADPFERPRAKAEQKDAE